MFKLIIADDEETIRRGMCNYINWESMGFTVEADFEDGKETLEYLETHPVDVVLTDIRMAEVSGLEVARFVAEKGLPVKVVILSGYREFEYARKAVEYNVEHYLLKPLQLEEVREVFGKIQEELGKQKKCKEQAEVERQALREQAEKHLQDIGKSVQQLLNMEFQTGTEKNPSLFPDLNRITDNLHNLHWKESESGKEIQMVPRDYELLMEKYKLLTERINDGDIKQLDELMDSIFFEFRKMPLERVKQLVVDMFSMLSRKLMKMGSDLWVSMNEIVDYGEILETNSFSDLKNQTEMLLEELCCLVCEKQNETSRKMVEEACIYMKEHYGEELFLENMAERCFLNPSYFSRLFKQYTGSTFTDYLIEIRMEKAKKLIEQGRYKIYEVSRMVGYRGEKYFFRVFKQYTGCSPTEYYRNQGLKNESKRQI